MEDFTEEKFKELLSLYFDENLVKDILNRTDEEKKETLEQIILHEKLNEEDREHFRKRDEYYYNKVHLK